jgi:hypothetical protein
VGQSWLLSTSSIKFLTIRSLKSQIYLAPREDNRIQLLSTIRPRRRKNSFMVHLNYINISKSCHHTIRIVDVTHVPVILFHDVRFHRLVAVIRKISFCWW